MKMGGSYDGVIKRQKLKKDYQYKIFWCPECNHTLATNGKCVRCGMCDVDMVEVKKLEDGE